ncbi:MAG: class I SAM-dependent methyltransferase [Nitriliruptor sp.]
MPLFDRLFAAAYDRVLASSERAGLTARRSELLADLTGHVVELGAGTGANLVAYGPGIERLTLLEPSTPMADRLRARVATTALDAEVEVLAAPGEALPLPDASVDTVVSTLVLCTVDDLARTLDEVDRVLRPGGRLVLIEHVAADDVRTARLQRLLRRPWLVVGRGCHLDRDPRAALAARGWDTSALENVALPMPMPTRPGQAGSVTR